MRGGFNRRHHRAGHLFHNRYKSIVVEEDPYLLELTRYIHLNPLRAKVVADLSALERYPRTGHSALARALGQTRGNVSLAAKRGAALAAAWRAQFAAWCR